MKRIINIAVIVFLPVITTLATSMNKHAYYIDFKSGAIQTLWTDWVDSMKVSKIDLEGVLQPDYVTQEVWLSDTVLRYSLDDIEQISFVTPPPVFKPGVIKFEDGLEKYITGCDSLTVFLQPNTPEKLLPKPKDLVCYMKMTEIFPAAFAGEVVRVQNVGNCIEMECTLASLLDIFDTYYSTWEEDQRTKSRVKLAANSGHNDHDFQHHVMEWKPENPYRFEITPFFKRLPTEPIDTTVFRNWKFVDKFIHPGDTIKASIFRDLEEAESIKGIIGSYEFNPNMEIRVTTTITRRHIGVPTAFYVCVHAKGNFTNSFSLSAFAKVSSGSKPWQLSLLDVPLTPNRFVTPYLNAGVFYEMAVQAGIGFNVTNKYETNWLYNFAINDEPPLRNERVKPTAKSPIMTTFGSHLNGYIAGGLFLELGFKFLDKNLLAIIAEGKLGLKAEGNLSIPMLGNSPEENAWVYDKLRDNHFTIAPYWGVGLKLEVNGNNVLGNQLSYESQIGRPWFERALVPDFADLSAERKKNNLSDIESKSSVSRTCLFPWRIGLGAFDKNKKLAKKVYFQDTYRAEKDFNSFKLDIENLSTAKEFTVKPLIEVANLDIPCSPDAAVNKVLTVTTGKAKNVTANQAVVTGKVEKVGEFDLENGKIDVKFFTKDGTPVNIEKNVSSSNKGNNIDFEINVTGLLPSSDYLYQANFTVEEEEICGNTLELQTDDAEIITLPVESFCAGTAHLRSTKGPNVEEMAYIVCEGHFNSVEELLADERMYTIEINEKYPVSGSSTSYTHLKPETEYTVCATGKHKDGTSVYGGLEYFTTKPDSIALEQDHRKPLENFYHQLSNEAQENLSKYGWLNDGPLCHWEGISHNEDGSVSIRFWGETLNGSPTLSLPYLNDLDINYTSFTSFTYTGKGIESVHLYNNKQMKELNILKSELNSKSLSIYSHSNTSLQKLNISECTAEISDTDPSGLYFSSTSQLPLLYINASVVGGVEVGNVKSLVIENSFVTYVGHGPTSKDTVDEIYIKNCKNLTNLTLWADRRVKQYYVSGCNVSGWLGIQCLNVVIENSTFNVSGGLVNANMVVRNCLVNNHYITNFSGKLSEFLNYLSTLDKENNQKA